MAQKRRFGSLARRYGLNSRTGAVAAALALLLGLGGFVAWKATAVEGVTIERAGSEEDSSEETDSKGDSSDESTSNEAEITAPTEVAADEPDEPQVVVVHVDGAVATPGVYTLEAGARANEAIEAAGGLLASADTTSLNLAAVLADGQKLYVPEEGEAVSTLEVSTSGSVAATVTNSTSSTADNGLININTASVEELCELPGVGEATATAIVEDREANGPFASPEDIMRVSGIGEKKFAKLEGLICV